MTLIAAFRCQEGVVLCADTQETVGDVRVAVNKLTPQDCGEYQLAIAGSGNGDLIEGFADSLARALRQWPAGASETFARNSIRDLLLEFHANEIEFYPAPEEEKLNHFLVCIKPKGSPDILLWELRGSTIVPVGSYALMGVGAAIYKHELEKLYRVGISANQAVILGVHLFSLAKATSNYVGFRTDVLFVNEETIWVHNEKYIRTLEKQIAAFNAKVAEIVLACSDTATDPTDLKPLLADFSAQAIMLHQSGYVDLANLLGHQQLDPHSPLLLYMMPPLEKVFEGLKQDAAEIQVMFEKNQDDENEPPF